MPLRLLVGAIWIGSSPIVGLANPLAWQEQTQGVSQEVEEARRRLGMVDGQTPIEKTLTDWGFKKTIGAYELSFSIPEPKYFHTCRVRITPYASNYDNTAYPDRFVNQLDRAPAYVRIVFEWDFAPRGRHSLTFNVQETRREDGFKDPVALVAALLPLVSQERIDPALVLAAPQVASRLAREQERIDAIKTEWAEVAAQLRPKGFAPKDPGDPFSLIAKDEVTLSLDLIPFKSFGGVTLIFRDPGTGLSALKYFDSVGEFKREIRAGM